MMETREIARKDLQTFDTLLHTRTFMQDYRWHFRPDYVGSDFDKILDPLLRMREDPNNRSFFLLEGKKNFYYLTGEKWLAIICLYVTDEKDQFGREISRLEGFCCPVSKGLFMRQFIPIFLCDMFSSENGDALGWYFPNGFLPQLEICNFSEVVRQSPMFLLEKELNSQMSDPSYNGFLRRIEENMLRSGASDSWILGSREKDFYLLKTEAYYSLVSVGNDLHAEKELVFAHPSQRTTECRMEGYLGKSISGYTLDTIIYRTDTGQKIAWQKDCQGIDNNWQAAIPLSELRNILSLWQECMNHTAGGFYFPKLPVKKAVFEKSYADSYADGIRYQTFRIDGIEKYRDSGFLFETPFDNIVWELFQNSLNLKYYFSNGNEGLHTMYILNLEDGLYFFWIYRRRRTSSTDTYHVKGYYFLPENRMEGWLRCPMLNFDDLSKDFQRKWNTFCEDYQRSALHNVIISAAYGKSDFPDIGIDEYHCVPTPADDLPAESDEMPVRFPADHPPLLPDDLTVIRRKKLRPSWEITYYEPSAMKQTNISSPYQQILLEPHIFILKSINRGKFDYDELMDEIQFYRKVIPEKDLYICPFCNSVDIYFEGTGDSRGQLKKKCNHCGRYVNYQVDD